MSRCKDIAGVILAGGASRRMGGGDKGLLDLDGTSLLQRVVDRLAPQVSTIVLNANGDPTRFYAHKIPVVSDSIDGLAGPLAGVLAGMDWAANNGFEWIATAAADTPLFPLDLVEKLSEGLTDGDRCLAMAVTPDPKRPFNRHPTFGLWHTDLREDLRAALEDGVRKVVQWTDKHGCVPVTFSASPFDPFFNVNTPDDMAEVEHLLQRHSA